MSRGRIVSIENKKLHHGTKVDGIKKHEQNQYDEKYYGSNGTYIKDIRTEHYLEMKIVVYGDTQEENKTVTVDIRNDVLKENHMKRISKKLLSDIQQQNVGNKINFELNDGKLLFPEGELKLKKK